MRIALALLLFASSFAAIADTPLPLLNELSGNWIFNLRVSEDLLVWQDDQAIQILNLADGTRRPSIHADLYELTRTDGGYALLSHAGGQPHVTELDRSGNVVSDTVMPWPGVTTGLAATPRRTLVVSRDGDAVFLDELELFRVTPGPTYGLTAAASNDGFLVAWNEEAGFYAAHVTSQGQASAPILLGDGGLYPTIASDGTSFLILWWSQAGELRGSIDAGPSFVVAPEAGPNSRAYWDGSAYVVLFDREGLLYETRVSAAGAVGATHAIPDVLPMTFDAVPSRLAWVARDQCWRGDALMLRAGGAADVAVSKGAPHQFSPSVSGGMRIWAERSERTRVYLNGGRLLSADAARNVNPVIDTSGPNALAVWTEDRDTGGDVCARSLHGAIVSPQGTVLRTFPISDDVLGQARPAVAWNGSQYAVVWERHSANVLVGVRIDAAGNVLELPKTLTNTTERGPYVNAVMEQPSLVWDGNRYVLVWGNVYSTYTPWFPDPPPRFDVRRQYLLHDLTLTGLVEILDSHGVEPASSIGPERGLIAWRLSEIHNVQLRIVTRESGALVIQRDLGGVDGPLLSAALQDEFVVVAGTGVYRVSEFAGVTPQEPLPAGAVPNGIDVTGERVSIAYTLDHRAYIRELTTESRPGRRRSVR
jgi:hypothetical protein